MVEQEIMYRMDCVSRLDAQHQEELQKVMRVSTEMKRFASMFTMPSARKRPRSEKEGEQGKEKEEACCSSSTEEEGEEEEEEGYSTNDYNEEERKGDNNNDDAQEEDAKDKVEPTGRIRGTLKILQEWWDKGLLQEGQCCSIEKTVVYRISGRICCVLSCVGEKLTIEPCQDILSLSDKSPHSGRIITRSFNDWLHETRLYRQTMDSKRRPFHLPHHFYDLICFHFALRAHPSFVIAVPIANLCLLQSIADEWMPVIHTSDTCASRASPPPADWGAAPPPPTNASPSVTLFGLQWKPCNQHGNYMDTLHHFGQPDASGSIYVYQDTEYGLELTNYMQQKHAAAAVYIDGRFQGEFLLRPNQSFILGRPVGTERRFMFVVRGVGHALSDIQVRFTPEKQCDDIIQLQRGDTTLRDAAAPPVSEEGQTFLSSPYQQPFSTAPHSYSFDEEASVTLRLKLVGRPKSHLLRLSDCRTL